MAVDEATWVRVRGAYEKGGRSVAALARDFAVSTSAIHRRAKLERWQRKPARDAGRRETVLPAQAGEAGAAVPPARKVDQERLIARLYGAIDTKLARLEARLSEDGPVSSADSEREARELSNMIRSFEKVTAVAGDLDKRRGKRGKSGAAGDGGADVERAADAERMRNEIAERLERLHRSGTLAGGTRAPDAE